MNPEEYAMFLATARIALTSKYDPQQIEKIMDFFTYIKAAEEYDLIGQEKLDAMLEFVSGVHFNVFDTMMARLFIYAPYILERND